MPTSNEVELRRLEAELEKTNGQEKAGAALLEANSAKAHADESLARARQKLDAAERCLRDHEENLKRAPDLIAEARFCPQRMLVSTEGGIDDEQRSTLIGLSETIADLRGFIDTADLRAARIRRDITSAKKPVALAEAAAKTANSNAARCQEDYDALMRTAMAEFTRDHALS